MKNFVQPADTVDVVAPEGGVSSGEGFLVGDMFVVALTAAAAGETVAARRVGGFDLPKAAVAISAGAKVFWDASEGQVTTTEADNKAIGHCPQGADEAAAEAFVVLVPNTTSIVAG